MDEMQIHNLVKGWYQRARRERDMTSKFVFLWFCFNAWLAYKSNKNTNNQIITWLTRRRAAGSQLQASYEVAAAATTSLFPGYLRTLVGLSPIISTGHRQREVRIASPDDFPNIIDKIYQVRRNLF